MAVAVAVAGPAIVAVHVHVHVHATVSVIERFRRLPRMENHQTLVEMACALIAYRAAIRRKDHAF